MNVKRKYFNRNKKLLSIRYRTNRYLCGERGKKGGKKEEEKNVKGTRSDKVINE